MYVCMYWLQFQSVVSWHCCLGLWWKHQGGKHMVVMVTTKQKKKDEGTRPGPKTSFKGITLNPNLLLLYLTSKWFHHLPIPLINNEDFNPLLLEDTKL